MTPEQLSQIHQDAYENMRPWSAQEFADLLQNPHVKLFTAPHGFALLQVIANEAELLSIAVAPKAQRSGVADQLMQNWMQQLNAHSAFLEVAADNLPAQKLYEKHRFKLVARRTGYYKRGPDPAVDALLMRCDFIGADA